MRVLGCTSTWMSEPESGVNVIVLPEMALMAPICLAGPRPPAASGVCGSLDGMARQAGTRPQTRSDGYADCKYHYPSSYRVHRRTCPITNNLHPQTGRNRCFTKFYGPSAGCALHLIESTSRARSEGR